MKGFPLQMLMMLTLSEFDVEIGEGPGGETYARVVLTVPFVDVGVVEAYSRWQRIPTKT
jgi:hypothetical protein